MQQMELAAEVALPLVLYEVRAAEAVLEKVSAVGATRGFGGHGSLGLRASLQAAAT